MGNPLTKILGISTGQVMCQHLMEAELLYVELYMYL